ncbi:10246_t:CDS:2, partial [Scutellospora calospora]
MPLKLTNSAIFLAKYQYIFVEVQYQKEQLVGSQKKVPVTTVQLVQVKLHELPQLAEHEKVGVPQELEDKIPLQVPFAIPDGKLQDVVFVLQVPHVTEQGRVPLQPEVIRR